MVAVLGGPSARLGLRLLWLGRAQVSGSPREGLGWA